MQRIRCFASEPFSIAGGLYNFRYNSATGQWPITTFAGPAGVVGFRSLTFKNGTGVPFLYMIAEPAIAGTGTNSIIYSFNLNTNAYVALASSASFNFWKGISLTPFVGNPTASTSPAPTPSITGSFSFTPSPTLSVGASAYPTPSRVPSATPTNGPPASVPPPVALFSGSVLVVRIGDRGTPLNQGNGFVATPVRAYVCKVCLRFKPICLQVYVDEILPTSQIIRQTIAMPVRPFVNSNGILQHGKRSTYVTLSKVLKRQFWSSLHVERGPVRSGTCRAMMSTCTSIISWCDCRRAMAA
jgi:hypothetical protein